MAVTEMAPRGGGSSGTSWTARILLLSVSIVFSLAVAEIGMRAVGFYPRPVRVELNRPAFNEPDAALGWRNKPGRYVFPGFTPDAADIRVTNWTNGRRATGQVDEPGRTTVALVGVRHTGLGAIRRGHVSVEAAAAVPRLQDRQLRHGRR